MARALIATPGSGRIAFFGELLLRLSAPNRELLLQSPTLSVFVGGAEANVAVGLASLGHETLFISAVPDNALGRAAVSAIRAHGVDCDGVRTAPGRMGLYFLSPGAGIRASEVLYDRAASSFCNLCSGKIEIAEQLNGARLLHLSGITPALGAAQAEAAIEVARTATRLGVPIAFDGNFRAQLWASWNSDPAHILRQIVEHTEIFFGNHRDISLILGRTFSGQGEVRRREAAEAMFAAFPTMKLIASTSRSIIDADCHRISARVDTRASGGQTNETDVSGIVDRIGAGDAFAAGVLHAMSTGADEREMAEVGLALTCLKHSLPGDASLFRQSDIDAFRAGQRDVRR